MSSGPTSWEPKRWADSASDAPPALQSALQDARVLDVDAERVARLAERLGVGGGVAALGTGALGASAVGASAVGASAVAVDAAVPAGGVVAYKLWAYLSGAVALSGLALFVWNQAVASAPSSPSDTHVMALKESLAPAAAAGQVDELAVEATTELEPEASAEPSIEAPPQAGATHTPDAIGNHAAAVRRRPVPAAATTPAQRPDPRAELAILNSAQDALAQAPRHALTLAEDHAEKFPQGVFAQEREVIAIGALLKLQRSQDATSRGRAFLAAFPTSTHAPRVQQMLGE